MNVRSLVAAAVITLLSVTSALALESISVALDGEPNPETNPEGAWLKGFADSLKDHGISVKIFPSDSIGNEKERLDQVSQDLINVDLATSSTPFTLSKRLQGLALPFFFESGEDFDDIMDHSDLLDQINEELVPNGIRLLGFNIVGEIGIHNTVHQVTTVEDLENLRMRAMNKGQLDFYRSLGVSGVIVSWGEIANALQTGVAEGYLNPPSASLRTGHTRFLKYYTPANIYAAVRLILVSDDWYQAMSAEERAIVDEAVANGRAVNRQWVNREKLQAHDKLEAAGVTISEFQAGEREKIVERARGTWSEVVPVDVLMLYEEAARQNR